MKCNHPGCYAFLTAEEALYPDLNAVKGGIHSLADIHRLGRHPSHGPGTSYTAAIMFYEIVLKGGSLTLGAPKTTPTPAKPTKDALKNRASAIRFAYKTLRGAGLSYEGSQKAAVRAFEKETALEKELQREASTERLIAINNSRRAAKQAASVEAA